MNRKIWSFIFVLFLTIANLGVGSSSSETAGTAIVAVRTSSVIGLGHVGVAFQNADGTWTAGAIEGAPKKTLHNLGGAVVFSSDENGAWSDKFNTLEDVEKEFLRRDYNYIKIIPVENSNPELATKKIQSFEKAGYFAPFNDCLTQTDAVLNEYGVKTNKNTQFAVSTTLMGPIGAAIQLSSVVIPNVYFYSLPGKEITLTQPSADQKASSQQNQDAAIDQSLGDLGGINLTSIKLSYISVNTNRSGGVDFDFILNAGKAEGTNPGIDPINSSLMAATAFMTGLAVPDNKFWVNLAPWEQDRIIDEQLSQSDVGRIMLEADLQMKRDFSNYGNPCANETGKALWDLLDKKREALVQQCMNKFPGEIKDIDNIRFLPVTRHWIVPDTVYAYTNETQIYIINATLTIKSEPVANHSSYQIYGEDTGTPSKGCLEELNKSAKEYGEYTKELTDLMILPYVVADLNAGKNYEELRDVYVALALAQWYKSTITSDMDIFRESLDSSNFTELKSIKPWSPNEIWDKCVYSFENGEYKCWENETIKNATGNLLLSSYRSEGGVDFGKIRANMVEIDELPPEVQNLVKMAIAHGFNDDGRDIFFGNRLHMDLRQDTTDSSSSYQADPNLALNWYNKGVVLQNQSKLDEAIQAYDQAIRLDSNLTMPWYNKGLALYSQGRHDEAIRAFDEAIRLDPNLAMAWHNKGSILNNQGKYDDAIKCYDEAIRLDPDEAQAWFNKGSALYNQGNYDEAIAAYDEAIRLDPNDALTLFSKCLALKSLGRTSEADVLLTKAKELGYSI